MAIEIHAISLLLIQGPDIKKRIKFLISDAFSVKAIAAKAAVRWHTYGFAFQSIRCASP
jgi:hypothetical protein